MFAAVILRMFAVLGAEVAFFSLYTYVGSVFHCLRMYFLLSSAGGLSTGKRPLHNVWFLAHLGCGMKLFVVLCAL